MEVMSTGVVKVVLQRVEPFVSPFYQFILNAVWASIVSQFRLFPLPPV